MVSTANATDRFNLLERQKRAIEYECSVTMNLRLTPFLPALTSHTKFISQIANPFQSLFFMFVTLCAFFSFSLFIIFYFCKHFIFFSMVVFSFFFFLSYRHILVQSVLQPDQSRQFSVYSLAIGLYHQKNWLCNHNFNF